MLSTAIGGAVVVLAAALLLRRTGGRPRGTDLVRVPGRVVSQHPLTLRWTIAYGPGQELTVARTLPERLSEGMPVAVLVDPSDPARARLDLPEREQFVRRVVLGVLAAVLVVALLAGAFAGLLFSLG